MAGTLIFLALMFGMFYFLLIRPQRKRQTEHKILIDSLQKGDRVITVGGIYGEIDFISDQDIVLKMEDGARIRFLKSSVMNKQVID